MFDIDQISFKLGDLKVDVDIYEIKGKKEPKIQVRKVMRPEKDVRMVFSGGIYIAISTKTLESQTGLKTPLRDEEVDWLKEVMEFLETFNYQIGE